MDCVAKMSTYELRQEAEKRGVLGELNTINHETLLRRLVQARFEACAATSDITGTCNSCRAALQYSYSPQSSCHRQRPIPLLPVTIVAAVLPSMD